MSIYDLTIIFELFYAIIFVFANFSSKLRFMNLVL